jgi:hypothetical protein
MTKVILSEDCGNSPKNIFVQKVTVALAKGDSKSILSNVTDDLRWNMIGRQVIEGKARAAQSLDEMKKDPVEILTIQHIATHGKAGAVNGTIRLRSGGLCGFCHMYEFSNSKGSAIKEITSYVIRIDDPIPGNEQRTENDIRRTT